MKKRVFVAALALAGIVALSASNLAFADEGTTASQKQSPNIQERSSNDTPWNFNFGPNGTDGSDIREKENSTSVYVYVKYKNVGSYNTYVDGLDNTAGGGRVNCTYRNKAVVTRTGEFQIYNSVYEKGKTYAQLTAWGPSGGVRAGGVWSPDTQNQWNYPVLNP